ncbi:TPA: tetratricopeptide repeat protein [Candidatus Poribacteria bacterium]|nr:tetratricopeptide repeat protein [Candidatus Poribacteria bacterium]
MLELVLTLFLLIPPLNPSTIQHPGIVVELPNRLFDEGDFHAALIEYKRYLHYNPNDPRRPYLEYRMGLCYLRTGRYEEAEKVLRSVAQRTSDDRLRQEVDLALAKALFWDDRYDSAKFIARRLTSHPLYADIAAQSLYLSAWCSLNEMDWGEATIKFRRAADLYPDHPISEKSSLLAEESLKALSLPRKSPDLARILSAVMPGSGLIYCGEGIRGIGYMAGNLITLFLATRAALEGDGLNLFIMGGTWAWIYLRGIRASYEAALRYNEEAERRYLNSLKSRFTPPDP